MAQLIKPNTCYTVSPTGKFGGKHLSITPAESESYSSIQNLLYNNSLLQFRPVRSCPISIIVGSVNYFLLYCKYKMLGASDCGWCMGIRQNYPAVERIPTSFVEERLYRKFYKFLSELPHFTLLWNT